MIGRIDSIRRLLVRGGEPGWYDWKEVLRLPKEDRPTALHYVCGMANTDGGYIVFGVEGQGATPDDRIVGIGLITRRGMILGR